MPNKARPRSPSCGAAMDPVYRKSARGKGFPRIANVFWCDDDAVLARGRTTSKSLFGPGRRRSA